MRALKIIHALATLLMIGYSMLSMFDVGMFLAWYHTGKPGPLMFCLIWLVDLALSCYAARSTKHAWGVGEALEGRGVTIDVLFLHIKIS